MLEHESVKYKPGEQVRHPGRPEWGVGEVTKVELITRDGQPDRRVWIRFPNEGTKTVLASVAGLEIVVRRRLPRPGGRCWIDRAPTRRAGSARSPRASRRMR